MDHLIINPILARTNTHLLVPAEEERKESLSSVELTKGQRGTYGWKIKLYFEGLDHQGIIDKINEIDEEIRQMVKQKPSYKNEDEVI